MVSPHQMAQINTLSISIQISFPIRRTTVVDSGFGTDIPRTEITAFVPFVKIASQRCDCYHGFIENCFNEWVRFLKSKPLRFLILWEFKRQQRSSHSRIVGVHWYHLVTNGITPNAVKILHTSTWHRLPWNASLSLFRPIKICYLLPSLFFLPLSVIHLIAQRVH